MTELTIGKYYTYQEANPSLGELSISTQVEDSGKDIETVRYGFRSYMTQKIANNFPAWMDLRENHESVAQKLISSWAYNIEDALSLYDEYRADQFFAKANTYKNINLGISQLSFDEEEVYEPNFKNLLFNSSFSINAPARYRAPAGWKIERNNIDALKLNKKESLFGTHALELDNSAGDAEIAMKQTREFSLSGGHLNLSVFVKTVDASGDTSTRFDAEEAGIILVLSFNDYTTKTYGVGFPVNTEGKWRRASFSVELQKELFKYEVIIINRAQKKYLIDLPQLEVGKTASSWTVSENDIPIQVEEETRKVGSVQVIVGGDYKQQTTKFELLEIPLEEDFREIAIPTRLVPFSLNKEPYNNIKRYFGKEITYMKEEMTINWLTSDNHIIQKSAYTPDRLGNPMLPADLFIDENGDKFLDTAAIDSSSIQVKGLTLLNNIIFAACKETYLERTIHTLKFIRPYKLNYEDTILQSIGDIQIPIDLSAIPELDIAETNITNIGICRDIPDCIFIDTDAEKRFYFKMKFDYFYANLSSRKLFCRENFTESNNKLQVI